MRGDSLRDFYAKTLAVLGLGLLAGAGAIVDYWPVNEELPTTPAVSGLTAAAPVLVRNLTPEIPAPTLSLPVMRSRPANFVIAADDRFDAVTIPASVSLGSAPAPAPVPANFVAVEPILTANASDESLGLGSPPLPDGMTDESRRMFADALRRTKERVAAARGLFNDAMSGMVGAFRKMSPFFTTTATVPGLE